MALQFAISASGDYLVTHLNGKLNLTASLELHIFLSEVFKQTDRVIVDLSQVPFMDAHGLDVFTDLQAWAAACGAQLRLAAPQPLACRLLALTDAYRQLAPFPTVHAAATADTSPTTG